MKNKFENLVTGKGKDALAIAEEIEKEEKALAQNIANANTATNANTSADAKPTTNTNAPVDSATKGGKNEDKKEEKSNTSSSNKKPNKNGGNGNKGANKNPKSPKVVLNANEIKKETQQQPATNTNPPTQNPPAQPEQNDDSNGNNVDNNTSSTDNSVNIDVSNTSTTVDANSSDTDDSSNEASEKTEEKAETPVAEVKVKPRKRTSQKVNKEEKDSAPDSDYSQITVRYKSKKLAKVFSLLLIGGMILLTVASFAFKTPIMDRANANGFISQLLNFNFGGGKSENISPNGLSFDTIKEFFNSNLPKNFNPEEFLESMTSSFNKKEKFVEPVQAHYEYLMRKSLNENKPANYYELLESYDTLLEENTQYQELKGQKDVYAFHKVVVEVDSKDVPTYVLDGETHSLNAVALGIAVRVEPDQIASINEKQEEIKTAIMFSLHSKKSSDLLDKDLIRETVKFAVKRISGVEPKEVYRFILVQPIKK